MLTHDIVMRGAAELRLLRLIARTGPAWDALEDPDTALAVLHFLAKMLQVGGYAPSLCDSMSNALMPSTQASVHHPCVAQPTDATLYHILSSLQVPSDCTQRVCLRGLCGWFARS